MAKKLPVASSKSKKVLKPQSNEALTNGKKTSAKNFTGRGYKEW